MIANNDECIDGKVVALHLRYLNDGYKFMSYQIYYIIEETEQERTTTANWRINYDFLEFILLY